MKLTVAFITAALLVTGTFARQAFADDGRTFNGAPVSISSVPFHIKGKAVTAQLIVASLHMMDHSGFQPTGLWEYFYVLPDSATGNAATCERWYNQVLTDQSAQTATSATRAWLEIHLSTQTVPIQTDEGTPLLADSGIQCWEALEFSPASH